MDELRAFTKEVVAASSLRTVARLIGRRHEQVRKFVDEDTENPHDRTLKAIADLYQAREDLLGGGPAAAVTASIRVVLPRGREAALTEVRRLFKRIAAAKDADPETVRALEAWVVRRVEEEYALEVSYRPRPARGAPKARSPRKKRS